MNASARRASWAVTLLGAIAAVVVAAAAMAIASCAAALPEEPAWVETVAAARLHDRDGAR